MKRANAWYLKNSHSSSGSDYFGFFYGDPVGDVPVIGNWDGVNQGGYGNADTIGIRRGLTWYLRNFNSSGTGDVPGFGFGDVTDRVIAGNWNGPADAIDTVGVTRAM